MAAQAVNNDNPLPAPAPKAKKANLASPLFLHENREAGCVVVSGDRKFYLFGKLFIKRTLRKHEWGKHSNGKQTWTAVPSASMPQRYRNDVAIQEYLRQRTNIPLPAFTQTFEDDGATYLVSQRIEGAGMYELSLEDRKVAQKELDQYIATLKSLRSETPGVPGVSNPDDQLLVAPPRLFHSRLNYHTCWRPRSDVKGDFVLSHGDLGQHNVLVDPKTLKITAIIDWEFGGFWPEWFESPFWTRHGGSWALEGEEDDTERCRAWLRAYCEPVEQEHLPTCREKLGSLRWTPTTSDGEDSDAEPEKGEAAAQETESEPAAQEVLLEPTPEETETGPAA